MQICSATQCDSTALPDLGSTVAKSDHDANMAQVSILYLSTINETPESTL